ncbi:MAG: hypothetical protein LC104_14885 [Bacteroidales bacterium]|nr:hypothetical protein [Bacteroidales bacterium]
MRGQGGSRHRRKSVHLSPHTECVDPSTDPATVAHALQATTGADTLYVADLDAIRQPSPHLAQTRTYSDAVRRLAHALPQTTLLVDSGTTAISNLPKSDATPNLWPILASESLREYPLPANRTAGALPVCGLSLDFRQGQWLGCRELWARYGITASTPPLAIARLLLQAVPARFVIVLDIATVGTTQGPSPFVLELLRQLRSEPALLGDADLIAGGGIRNRDDIARFADAGADAVLVASALHDRRLP